ncbi:MAG: PAS domain S-box protein [Candidatus Aminicenantales bacterium]
MKDTNKTKEQLFKEIQELRHRIAELEIIEATRQRAEQALQESEKKYRFLVDNSKEVILIISKKGKILFANNSTLTNYGYSKEELIGRSIIHFLTKDCIRTVLYALAQEFLGHLQPEMEVQFKSKSGEKRYLNVAQGSTPIYEKGKLAGVMVSAGDITERKRAERVLRESEEKFRNLAEQSPNMIFINKKGRIVYANEKCEEIMGYKRKEFYSPDFDFFCLIAPEFRDATKESFGKHIKGKDVPPLEYALLTREGKRIEAIMTTKLIDFEGEKAILGTVTDITERKKAEKGRMESEARYRDLIEAARDAIFTLSPLGVFTSANRASEMITGWSTQEWIGKPFTDLLDPDDISVSIERFKALLVGRMGEPIEVNLRTKKGDKVPVELYATPQMKEGKIIGILGIARDITHRKQAEEQIRRSLKEKEVLLREIHHRVKNNMQVISSLLRLQAEQISDANFREMLNASQSRIRSMALVHEKLYKSKDLSHINFFDYIQSLAAHLFQFNQVRQDLIQLKINVGNVFLDIQTAIPCGLIINELISNSLKHAFPGVQNGEIVVELHPLEEHMFRMAVRDNGVGLPKDMDIRNPKYFGLQIVIMLVEQLEGSVEVQREGGTTFKIVFKELKYKSRL